MNLSECTPDALALISYYQIERFVDEGTPVLVIDCVDDGISPVVLTKLADIWAALGIDVSDLNSDE